MKNLIEAVQISPIPNRDKTLLVITSMFSKTIFYNVGVQSFYRIDSVDIEKFCIFINMINLKYSTSYIYNPDMYYADDIYQFIDITDENDYIKNELIKIGQTLMNKFINKLTIDDNGMIPVHKSVTFSEFKENNYQFDYTLWTFESIVSNKTDSFITLFANIHPSDVNWECSIMYAIYHPELKLLITNNVTDITGIHTSEHDF